MKTFCARKLVKSFLYQLCFVKIFRNVTISVKNCLGLFLIPAQSPGKFSVNFFFRKAFFWHPNIKPALSSLICRPKYKAGWNLHNIMDGHHEKGIMWKHHGLALWKCLMEWQYGITHWRFFTGGWISVKIDDKEIQSIQTFSGVEYLLMLRIKIFKKRHILGMYFSPTSGNWKHCT